MSRIFDALRQSEQDGKKSTLLGSCTPTSDALYSSPIVAPVIEPDARSFEDASVLPVEACRKQIVRFGSDQNAAERFSVLAGRINQIRLERELKCLLVTSSVLDEGKSTITLNLAATLAQQTRKKVLLIDGDLRKGSIAERLKVPNAPGLGDWAHSEQPIRSYLRRFPEWPLWILPAGKSDSPAELLESRILAELMLTLAGSFDYVIIDSPPLLAVGDANLWARIADGIILVVREGVTPTKALRRALDSLDYPKLLGVVFNDSTDRVKRNYYSRYYGGNPKG